MKEKKRWILYVLLIAALILSACTATGSAPTSDGEVKTAPTKSAAPTETVPPTAKNTPTVAPTNQTSIFKNTGKNENQEWQYVALGAPHSTNTTQGYPNILAEKIERQQDVTIAIKTWNLQEGIGGTLGEDNSTKLLEKIKGNQSLRDDLSNAELITFFVPLDGFVEASFTYMEEPGECGGDDHQDCLREALETYKQDTEDIVSELISLIDMGSTVVLAHTPWPAFVTYSKETGAFDVLNKYWKEAKSHLISICEEYGIPVARVYEAFMGADDSKNPEDDGLLYSSWYIDLEPEGEEIVANLLYELVNSRGTNDFIEFSRFGRGAINEIAIRPDGKTLSMASDVGIWVYELESLETSIFINHASWKNSVAWSPNGRQLALVDYDRTVRILDTDSGEQLAVLGGQDPGFFSVAWSPDGRQLASGGNDGTVHIWDAENWKQLAVLEGPSAPILAWSQDGQKLASVEWGWVDIETVYIRDADNGEQLVVLEGHTGQINDVTWSPDGRQLASGGVDGTVRIWNADSGEQLAVLQGHTDGVGSVAWSPDGQKLASGGGDGMIRIWDAESWEQLAVLVGHTSYVNSLAWSSDGQKLVSGGDHGTVRIWEIPGEFGVERAVAHGEPLSATEVERTAAEFEALANVVEAYETGDVEAAIANYTDDIVHNDATFFVHLVGIDRVGSMVSSFMTQFSKIMQSHFAEMYISSEDGITVVESWNFHLGAHMFTQEEPMVEVDLLETRDGRISYWTLFYDLDTLEAIKGGASTERLDEASSLLSSYGEAWSSGNPQMVGGLYADDAVREDSLFQERQEGPEAIMSFAESFFAWYPDAQWNLLLPFGEGHGDAPRTGGVYAINVSDPNGQTCEVHIAVLLNTSEDLIVQETLYYEPDSLISCGWAR